MMAFLLFLTVFAITLSNGKARSLTDKHIRQNMITSDEHPSVGEIFNLPKDFALGHTITISGKLRSSDKFFKVTLRGDKETSEYCGILFDFESETIKVTSPKETESEKYIINGEIGETFTLRITARTHEVVLVDFEINQLEPSSPVFCDIGELGNIKYIEVQKGVARIDSLLFKLYKINS